MSQFPLPAVEAGEALVRVECCTICGSDLHTVTGARIERVPSILGHEVLGHVDRVGDPPPCDLEGIPLRPGDRITWSTSISCGVCDRCQVGLPQKCRVLAKYGHELAEGRYALSGGLSQYLLLRRGSTAIRIDVRLSAELICPVNCATATIAAAFRTAGPALGRNVLILGAGMLGLTAAAFAKSHGASAVTVSEINTKRLDRAARFGADCAVEWHHDPTEFRDRLLRHGKRVQFDLVLELSGSPQAVETAIAVADVGARIVLVGSVAKSRPVQVDPESIVRRWISIYGVHNYAPIDLRSAVSFLEEYGSSYPFTDLVEEKYSLSELNAAIERAIHDRPCRVAIRP